MLLPRSSRYVKFTRPYVKRLLLWSAGQKKSVQLTMLLKWFFPLLQLFDPALDSFLLCSVILFIFIFFVGEQAAMEREVELEHRAAEASTALARIQVW